MSQPPTATRRVRVFWSVVVAGALVIAGLVVAVLVTTHHSTHRPPPLAADANTFRITPQPSSGNPAPQFVAVGSTRIGFSLGGITNDGGRPTAGMAVVAPTEPGQPSRAFANYHVGDIITLGRIRVTVLAIYVATDGEAVDVHITRE
jgi:hypothetical protein